MKKIIASSLWLLLGLGSISASAALKEGDVAPDFQAQASLDGKSFNFSLKEALKKGPVVVYFYPSAYTGGCNVQAHTFAEKHEQFAAAGATIIGVSLDSIERLNEFSADPDYCAGKFPVASDAGGKIAKAYELNVREASPGRKDTRGKEIDHGFAERTTFIIKTDGKIGNTVGGIAPAENVERALESVQSLAAVKGLPKKP
ncbi:peroxiredoxin [Methylobacillus arboreus]|uniref:peroxiredoxin n=1 Tax=Methylobacillus arboreus TaxID=755170 RepID=UPI001E500DF2|nr:peroxiredoxin [Methylobacillus arboreus]MCB5189136.1 peroxiredoxin [Methylobacillus arboreus]